MQKMKNNILISTALASAALSISLNAAVVTWTGTAADGLWATAGNWDTGSTPTAGDDIYISNGDTVNSIEFNSAYSITLSGNSTLADPVTNFAGGVFRAGGATLNVGVGSTLGSGGFWDFDNASVTYADGAAVNMSNWEHKNTNVFEFDLSATGFTTLSPGNLNASSASSTTYRADLTDYTGGVGVIDLVDFGGDSTGLTNAIFTGGGQYTLDVIAPAGYTANLQWDDAGDIVQLNITAAPPIPEPSSIALLSLAGLGFISRRKRS